MCHTIIVFLGGIMNNNKDLEKISNLSERLRAEKLYTFTDPYKENGIINMGYYTYNPIIKEVFEEVGVYNPEFETYENHLAKKSELELTTKEIIEQFIFWSRGERFCEGLIAEAIDSGQFVKLFDIYCSKTNPKKA